MSVICFDEEKLQAVTPQERGLLKALYADVNVDHSTWVKQRYAGKDDCLCCPGGDEYVADIKGSTSCYIVVKIEDARE